MVRLTQSFRNPVPEIVRPKGSPRISQPCRFSHPVWQMWSVHTSGGLIPFRCPVMWTPPGREAVVRPTQPEWSASLRKPRRLSQPAGQGTQAITLRPGCSRKQRASQSQSALPMQRRCGPAAGTGESVIKTVSRMQLVECRGSPVSQMQLVTQTDTACQAQMPSARYGQSVSCGRADRSLVLVRQAPMKSVSSQTQPRITRL